MLKKIVSLIIVTSLSVSMLTGCTFVLPLIEHFAEKDTSNGDINSGFKNDNKASNDGVTNKDEVEQDLKLSPEIEAILTADANPANELLYKIYKSEYRPSSFVQEDVESDTIKWICATYAIYNDRNNKDQDIIGGYWEINPAIKDEQRMEEMKKFLSDACGVDGRNSLVEAICVLLNFGNNGRYNLEVQEMLANGDMDSDLIEKYGRGPEVFRKLAVQKAYQRFGKNGLMGWDLSRVNQILGDAYYVEYISLEESLDLSLLVSQIIQNTFGDWDEFYESYLYGQQFLRQDAADNPLTETATEWETYEYLKERADDGRGPLEIPFDTKLRTNWSEEALNAEDREVPFDKRTPTKDEDGRITLYLRNERGFQVKVRIPDGFEMAEIANPLSVYASKPNEDVFVIYRVESRSSIEDVRDIFEVGKEYDVERRPDDAKLLTEKYEESEDEVTYYYSVEIKNHYGEGNDTVGYTGFKARNIDGKWIGLYSVMEARKDVVFTEEEAVSWLFSDVAFPQMTKGENDE